MKDLTNNSILLIEKSLGIAGRLISGSKSGYRKINPNGFPIFNSNLCTDQGKIWHGDIDVALDKEALCELAKKLKTDLYLLYEMDARFENEKSPRLKQAAFTFYKNGTFSIREDLVQYVHKSITDDSKHSI